MRAACLENRGSGGPLDYVVKGLPKTFLLLKTHDPREMLEAAGGFCYG